MTVILLRTIIIYALLVGALRLMGKRQIGELEVSDLVTTLILSEIATIPMENPEIPILYAVVPIITLLFIEICLSQVLISCPPVKRILTARPTVLVRNGAPVLEELRRARITIEELLSELRQKEVTDISEVDYAILEQNGKISVLRKRLYQPPDSLALHLTPEEPGITHILISDGTINRYNLNALPDGHARLQNALQEHRCKVKDITLMLIDDCGRVQVFLRPKCKNQKGADV